MFSDEDLHRSPVHERMEMTVVKQEPGLAVLSMPLSGYMSGFVEGTIHGGMLATFVDAACACCLIGCYDFPADITVTTDMHVRYYRQPRGGPLTAEAKMVHRGRRLLSTEGSVVDADNRVLIRATATYMVVPTGGKDMPSGGG